MVTEDGVHEYPWGQFAAGVVGCKRVKSQKIDIPFEDIQKAVAHAKHVPTSLYAPEEGAAAAADAPSVILLNKAKSPDLLPPIPPMMHGGASLEPAPKII